MVSFLGNVKTMSLAVLGVSAALTLSGCSISDSVGPISGSTGSSASSNNSSEKDKKADDDNRYENEVQDFTVTFLRTNSSQANQNSFMKGISDVASQNSIVDWEANPQTYRGIGKGLKKAKISGYQLEFYKKKFANGDSGKMDDIQEGYED
ncbi:MAG: putative lipoprotein [Methyloglobulus sp.]|nr:putative lipoprotein [Methyloglobulus sp.]